MYFLCMKRVHGTSQCTQGRSGQKPALRAAPGVAEALALCARAPKDAYRTDKRGLEAAVEIAVKMCAAMCAVEDFRYSVRIVAGEHGFQRG